MITWLHLVHVLSAMVWVGGGLTMLVLALRSRASSAAAIEFARTLPYVGIRVLMPAVVLLPVTGVWMVLGDSEWKFSQLWVRLGVGLFVLAFLVGAVYLSRVGIQIGRAADETGADRMRMAGLVNRWLVGYVVVLAALLIALWDMVFKPGT